MSRVQSALEIKACEKIEAWKDIILAAEAWLGVADKIADISQAFRSKWGLVKDTHEEKQKPTEEWVTNVLVRWIEMLEDLVLRTRKQESDGETSAGTANIGQPSFPLPLFYEPLRPGLW